MVRLKLRLTAIAIAAIIMTFLTETTLSYYTTVGLATNVVTSGKITFKIHETTDQGTEFPKEGVYVIPGQVVGKRVTIENLCEHPFYLRVKLVSGVNSEELSSEDCLKLDINKENWALDDDGWYYYNGIVDPGATTEQVFSHVEIVGDKVDNKYIGKVLSLTVKAQAVQSENNPISGTDYSEVVGWPEE